MESVKHRNESYQKAKKLLEEINLNSQNNISKEYKIRIYELMAKIFDQLDDTNNAFKLFTKINKLDKQSNNNKKYFKEKTIELIEQNKKYFVKDNLNKWTNTFYDKNITPPIFLIGFPRSGTTLMDTILRTHPKINLIEEEPTVANMKKELLKMTANKLEKLNDLNKKDLILLRKIYFEKRKQYIEKKTNDIIIDKMPFNIMNVGLINRVLPESKFIFALRHPCDCILSCFMNRFQINNATAHFYNIDDATNLYNEIMLLWKQFTEVLKIEYKIIKYEDLLENLEITYSFS